MTPETNQDSVAAAKSYRFERGYPSGETGDRAYDEADLNRAITAYKFFYPTVSGVAMIEGNIPVGLVLNKVFGTLECNPSQLMFTGNSDTPYGPMDLDLSVGPLVIELQPGPLIVCSIDLNQRWVADMGLPGPDAGKGGRHVLVGPDYTGELPNDGYYIHRASSNLQIVGARSLPVNGDVAEAKERLRTIKVYPLNPTPSWEEPKWLDLSGVEQDTTPLAWEDNFQFWEKQHKALDAGPLYEGYHNEYGDLAALGIERANRLSRIRG